MLQLEAVTRPLVPRLQSGGGAPSILPEPRGGAGRPSLFCPLGGGGTLQACSPLLTLVSGLMILLPFLSLGHRDPLALGHLAPRRHSPEAQGTLVKLLPGERSGHWVGKRGLTGGFRPVLPLSPQVSQPCPCVSGAPG